MANSPRKIFIVAGARPNFMKIAPLLRELQRYRDRAHPILIHTGQHYDTGMSDIFFRHLKIPKPDICLNVGSASHAVQTARIMTAFEKALLRECPWLVLVVGDVNSTLACSLVASKMQIKIAHVEAGLRSFDPAMPEEINRRITDTLSDYLFVTEPSGLKNLKSEGIGPQKIFYVGNIMIDTLIMNRSLINRSGILEKIACDIRKPIRPRQYAVLTLHRPANVDYPPSLKNIWNILQDVCEQIPVIYPVHPRTAKTLRRLGFRKRFRSIPHLCMIDPIGYLDFISLVKNSQMVLTDSGGIQEETTFLNIPCLTMRDTTERPITVTQGTNYLTGTDHARILKTVRTIIQGRGKHGSRPRFWDGRTAKRIIKILLNTKKPKKGM